MLYILILFVLNLYKFFIFFDVFVYLFIINKVDFFVGIGRIVFICNVYEYKDVGNKDCLSLCCFFVLISFLKLCYIRVRIFDFLLKEKFLIIF